MRGTSHFAVSPGEALTTRMRSCLARSSCSDRAAQAFEAGADARVDQPGGVGQLDGARAAMKQLEPQQVLETADLVAERSRRHVQLLGRFGETDVAGGGLEGPERVQGRQGAAHD